MSRQLWKQLLDNPTQALDPEAAGLTVIASGGEAAYHYAVRRWLGIRAGHEPDAQAAIAVILAEAFEDRRALDVLAEASPEPYPEALSRFTGALGPSSLVAEVFGERILDGLRAYLDDEADLPFGLLAAAGRFRLDDRGEIYLPLRRVAIERTNGTSSATLGASFSDRALEVAAAATPGRADVQRTVLAHWGMNFPADEVPIEQSRPGFAPTRWIATSHLITGVDRPTIADVFIELALAYGYWRTPTTDAAAFVRALRDSCGTTAGDALTEISRARVPVSGAASTALTERQTRIEAGTAPMRDRVEAIRQRLLDTRLLDTRQVDTRLLDSRRLDIRQLDTRQLDTRVRGTAAPVTGVERLVDQLAGQLAGQREPSDRSIAIQLLVALGSAAPLRLMGTIEPPFVEAVAIAARLSGQSVGFDHAFLEPTEDADAWILRFTREGIPHTRRLTSSGNCLRPETVVAFTEEASAALANPASAALASEDPRRLLVLDHDYLDAVIGFVDPIGWQEFLAEHPCAAD